MYMDCEFAVLKRDKTRQYVRKKKVKMFLCKSTIY